MRNLLSIAAIALFSSFSTWLVLDRAASAKVHSAQIVTDEHEDVVRIVIDGQEIVRIDSEGMAVKGVLKPERLIHPVPARPGEGGNE